MLKKITAVKARQNLGQIMNEVAIRNDQFIIERSGKAVAAVVPVWLLEQWLKRREEFFHTVEEIKEQNKGYSEDEIVRDVEAAVRAVRLQDKRDDESGAPTVK